MDIKSNCKCSPFPFKPNPPCFGICTGRILRIANRFDLEQTFEIETDTVSKIIFINGAHQVESLEDYRKFFKPDEFDLLYNIFSNLNNNNKALDWLRKKFGNNDDDNSNNEEFNFIEPPVGMTVG